MATDLNDPGTLPPVIPGQDESRSADEQFLRFCMSHLTGMASQGQWRLGSQLQTQSHQWGSVLRIDFRMPAEPKSNLINRIICWQPPSDLFKLTLAIGQDVPPLDAAAAPDRQEPRQ